MKIIGSPEALAKFILDMDGKVILRGTYEELVQFALLMDTLEGLDDEASGQEG